MSWSSVAGSSTDAGAGILSPETAKRDDPGWIELVVVAGRHYETLLTRLDPDTGWARRGIAPRSSISEPFSPARFQN